MEDKVKRIATDDQYMRIGKLMDLRSRCGPDEKVHVRGKDPVIVKKTRYVLLAKARKAIHAIKATMRPGRWRLPQRQKGSR